MKVVISKFHYRGGVLGLVLELPWKIGNRKGISERNCGVKKRRIDFDQQKPLLKNTESSFVRGQKGNRNDAVEL